MSMDKSIELFGRYWRLWVWQHPMLGWPNLYRNVDIVGCWLFTWWRFWLETGRLR